MESLARRVLPLLLAAAAVEPLLSRSADLSAQEARVDCHTSLHAPDPLCPAQPARRLSLGYDEMCTPSSFAGTCEHKPLLPHITRLDVITASLFLVTSALAMSAGIGGGGIFVPILVLLLRFPPQVATALSQSLIFGGSIGAFFVNAFARHPHDEARPLIDVGVASFLAPAEMAGALLGVILNQMLPVLVILLAMSVLLSVIAVQTLRRGLSQWVTERETLSSETSSNLLCLKRERRFLILADEPSLRGQQEEDGGEGGSEGEALPENDGEKVLTMQEEGQAAQAREAAASPSKDDRRWQMSDLLRSACFSVKKFLTLALDPHDGSLGVASSSDITSDVVSLVCIWFGLLGLLLLRGGKGIPSAIGIPVCGTAYWVITALSFVVLLGFSAKGGRRLVAKSRREGPVSEEVSWDSETAAIAMGTTVFAGVFAGMMGVGGGLVLGPLMLHIGMQPQVSTATTATMVLLTSSSAAALFLLSGVSPVDYSGFFGAMTLIGGYWGKRLLGHLVRRYRCNALIILILGTMVAVSMVAITAVGISNLEDRIRAGSGLRALLAFRKVCAHRN